MPGIASRYLQWLRQSNHISQMFLSVEKPTTLWVARVTGGLSVGETDITFNSGTGTGFSAITDYQEVWLGVAEDDYSYGKLRIRSISSGDGGVTGTVTVARHGHHLPDGLWLTFKHNYPLRPVYPYIDGSGDFYKDGDITYTDQNDTPNPVVIAGPNQAGFIYDGAWTIDVDMSDSYPIAPGATIATYGATVYPTTGVTITINPATGLGDIEFTVPGQYWVKYAVVDSNGKNQSSRRWYYAHSTDPTSEHYPYTDFQVSSLEGDYESGGWNCVVTSSTTRTLLEIPDEAICVLWQLATYDDDELTPLDEPYDGRQVVLSGYNNGETWSTDLKTGVNIAGFNIATIDERMRGIYMFSVSLEARPDPTTWYEYLPQLTVGRAIHHLWRWHSTLLQIADVYDLTANEDGRAYAEMDEGSIYGMANDLALQKGIRARVVCGKGGDVHICPDVQLLTDSERAALDICFEIEDTDRSDSIAITRNTARSSSFAKVSGFYYAKTLTGTECPNTPCPDVEPYCSSAPGLLPTSEGGYSVAVLDKQVLRSQSHCDELAGRLQAAQNKEYSEIVVPLHGNYLPFIDICYPDWYIMSLTTSQNARGIAWVNKNLILRNITCSYDGMMGVLHVQLALEAEQEGFDGVPGYCLDEVPEAPGDPPLPPAATGYGVYTAASVNFKDFVQEAWVNLTAEATNDMVYADYSGVLWRCGTGYVKASIDGGVNWSDVTPAAGPVDPSLVDYVSIDTNVVIGGRVYVLGNIGGVGYILATDDAGVSWSWVSLGVTGSTTPSVDEFGSGYLVEANQSISGWGVTNLSTCINLTTDYYLIVHSSWAGSSWGIGDVNLTYIYMPSTSSMTVLDTVTVKSGVASRGLALAKIDSDEYVVLYSYTPTTSFPSADLAATPGTLGPGDTLVLGSEVAIATGSGSYGVTSVDMAAMPNNKVAFIYHNGGTSPTKNVYVRAGTVTGGSLTVGAELYIGHLAALNSTPTVQVADTDQFVACAYNSITENAIICTCELSGNTVSIIDTLVHACPAGTDHATISVATNRKFVFGVCTDASGSDKITLYPGTIDALFQNIAIGSAPSSALDASDYFFALEQFDSDYGAIVYGVTGAGGHILRAGFYDNDAVIYSTTFSNQPDTGTAYWGSVGVAVTSSGLLIANENRTYPSAMSADLYVHLVDVVGGGGGGAGGLGIGLAADRLTGAYVWVTVYNGYGMYLQEYNFAGALTNTYGLGSATSGQVLARTRYAYPFAAWDGSKCFVFGKMTDVGGVGPAHIAVLDSGSWTVVENSWGADICGSFVAEVDGTLSAVRVATVAKLYRGDELTGMSLVSSLPIYDVAAKAMAVGYYVGDIYIGSYDAGAIMVIRSIPPFASWADITSNHQNTDPINAVVLVQAFL